MPIVKYSFLIKIRSRQHLFPYTMWPRCGRYQSHKMTHKALLRRRRKTVAQNLHFPRATPYRMQLSQKILGIVAAAWTMSTVFWSNHVDTRGRGAKKPAHQLNVVALNKQNELYREKNCECRAQSLIRFFFFFVLSLLPMFAWRVSSGYA